MTLLLLGYFCGFRTIIKRSLRATLGVTALYVMLISTTQSPVYADTGDVATGEVATWTISTGENEIDSQITEATGTTILITIQTSDVTDALEDALDLAQEEDDPNASMYEAMIDYLSYKEADLHLAYLKQFVDNLKQQDEDEFNTQYWLDYEQLVETLEEIIDTLDEAAAEETGEEEEETEPEDADDRFEMEAITHNETEYTFYTLQEGKSFKMATYHLSDKSTYTCEHEQCRKVAFPEDKKVVQIFATIHRQEGVRIVF